MGLIAAYVLMFACAGLFLLAAVGAATGEGAVARKSLGGAVLMLALIGLIPLVASLAG